MLRKMSGEHLADVIQFPSDRIRGSYSDRFYSGLGASITYLYEEEVSAQHETTDSALPSQAKLPQDSPRDVPVVKKHRPAWAKPCHSNGDLYFEPDEPETIDEMIARTSGAIALCEQCDIKKQCFDEALTRKENEGVWGGRLFRNGTPVELSRLKSKKRNR